MSTINSWDVSDFPQKCNDGTYQYGCEGHGGLYQDPQTKDRMVFEAPPPPISSPNMSNKTKFDVSSLTENERIGIFIGATLVVLYFLNKN